jgi:hypothetical protein
MDVVRYKQEAGMHFSRYELGMIWDALVEFIHTSEENLYRYGDTMPGDKVDSEEEYIEDLRALKGKVSDLL